ncbi:MAG: hypothetical protein R3F56_02515 [Planctomycetota bacterium]
MRARLRLVFPMLLLAACSDADPIGIHVQLQADGSGVVTCRSLQMVDAPGPLETDSGGVQWQQRARLFASRGTFQSVGDIRLADIVFKRTGENSLRLQLPRGPQATWHALLAPTAEGRDAAASVLDPARPATAVGSTIRIEVQAPDLVTAVGHAPPVRMAKSDKDGRSALLWVPVDAARSAGDPLVFDLTWR